MSDTRDARGPQARPGARPSAAGAPANRPAVPGALSPKPPIVNSPRPPAVVGRPVTPPRQPSAPAFNREAREVRESRESRRQGDSEPPEGGWDEAETAVEFPPEPPSPPKPVTRVAPESSPVVAERAPETRMQEPRVIEARAPEKRAPEARPAETRANMTPSTREEIWTIVRAAVEEAVAPVSAKLRDTEARLDRAEREIATRPVVQAPPTPRSGGVSPVARDVPVLPPDAFPHDDLGAKRALPSSDAPPAKKPSYIPTSYGLVTAHPPGPRPTADLDLSNVGPIDVPDFGNRRRLIGRIVVGVMLLCVAGAIVATVLSHA